MKEYSIYINNLRHFRIPVSNLSFKDYLSALFEIVLKNDVTGIHSEMFASFINRTGIVSSSTAGHKKSFLSLLNGVEVSSSQAEVVKKLLTSATENKIEIVQSPAKLIKGFPEEIENGIGVTSSVESCEKISSADFAASIGIDTSMGSGEKLSSPTLDTDGSIAVECQCSETMEMCMSAEPSSVAFNNADATVYLARYGLLSDYDDLTLDEMDDTALEDLYYLVN